MLTVEQALTRILEKLTPLPEESVSILDAPGRVLARPLVARRRLPGFDNSAMDGYAVRSADVAHARENQPTVLRVVATIPAGGATDRRLDRGEAMRIFTGAPLPTGADAVVMQEETELHQDEVRVRIAARPGDHIRFAGEDVEPGTPLADVGHPLRPGAVAMIAAQGQSWVQVIRQPRVAILPTGDEVIEIDRPLVAGQVANSNAMLLAAQIRDAGAIPNRCPVAPDRPEALVEQLTAAARGNDLILTSGGVSVGDFDHVREVLATQGTIDFWRVAMKPGKPLAFGEIDGVPLIGLPGNPVSTFVCFELFARPAIRRLMGHTQLVRRAVSAQLTSPLQPNPTRREFVRAVLSDDAVGARVEPLPQRGSAQLHSLLLANALIDLPAGGDPLSPGSVVSVLPL